MTPHPAVSIVSACLSPGHRVQCSKLPQFRLPSPPTATMVLRSLGVTQPLNYSCLPAPLLYATCIAQLGPGTARSSQDSSSVRLNDGCPKWEWELEHSALTHYQFTLRPARRPRLVPDPPRFPSDLLPSRFRPDFDHFRPTSEPTAFDRSRSDIDPIPIRYQSFLHPGLATFRHCHASSPLLNLLWPAADHLPLLSGRLRPALDPLPTVYDPLLPRFRPAAARPLSRLSPHWACEEVWQSAGNFRQRRVIDASSGGVETVG